MIKTYTYPNLPVGYCLVSAEELGEANYQLNVMGDTIAHLQEDLSRMVDHLERIVDYDSEIVHLVQSAEGIFKKVMPHLDAHKHRTVKGQLAKAREDCSYLTDAYTEADNDLDEVVKAWAFLRAED